ncbi:class I SAM-dependent methyltransferase [Glaciihabitans arcticus]|uniref:Class I SAM-dependent methyltransferase n=1 Tax=Glaciihabitans arcticus TaxID=2668039 RepID=A0A4Q9GN36_9MICO|nr:class I SAM-dependent methyltransferase [Glaciihabitans arcticus]TBN56101.1 class I SAM-dependent methyltransferase [Glaciihabitans arcticus]
MSWSQLATEWAELWGELGRPAWAAVAESTGIRSGSRVLDVGCGSGEFLAYAASLGATVAGVDPAEGMVDLARTRVTNVELGDFGSLPAGPFDVVTAFNALQFADDTDDALAALVAVTAPAGFVAIVNWAERELNDLDVLERSVDEGEPSPDGDLRLPGGLEQLLADGGLELVASGAVAVPWVLASDDDLVRGVLLGEDASVQRELGPTVLAAAAPFRQGDGYRLLNHFRYAIGTVVE